MTVLALLLSLLLGYAPATASVAEPDRSALRLGKSDAAKSGAVLRGGSRLHGDDKDGDELLAAAPPRPVTSLQSLHPAAAPVADGICALRPRPTLAYRARAPPAV